MNFGHEADCQDCGQGGTGEEDEAIGRHGLPSISLVEQAYNDGQQSHRESQHIGNAHQDVQSCQDARQEHEQHVPALYPSPQQGDGQHIEDDGAQVVAQGVGWSDEGAHHQSAAQRDGTLIDVTPQHVIQDDGTHRVECHAQQPHPAHTHRGKQRLERAADDATQVVHEIILHARWVREDVVIEGEVEARIGNVHAEEYAQQLIQHQQHHDQPKQTSRVAAGVRQPIHRRLEIAQVGSVGMGKHHPVAAAVAVGYQLTLFNIGHRLNDATPLLGTIAVGRGKSSRQPAIGIHLHLGGKHGHIPALEPRLDPVNDARCHDHDLVAAVKGPPHGVFCLGTRQRGLMMGGEIPSQSLKFLLWHPLDKVTDEPFLGLTAMQQAQLE